MGLCQQSLTGFLHDRNISELLLPVGRVQHFILLHIPFKNDIIGLFHDDSVSFKSQPQFLLSLFGLSDIDQCPEDMFLSVRPCHQISLIQNPYDLPVPCHNAVLQFNNIPRTQLFFRLSQDFLPVRRVNDLKIMSAEFFFDFPGLIAEQIFQPFIDLKHRKIFIV